MGVLQQFWLYKICETDLYIFAKVPAIEIFIPVGDWDGHFDTPAGVFNNALRISNDWFQTETQLLLSSHPWVSSCFCSMAGRSSGQILVQFAVGHDLDIE